VFFPKLENTVPNYAFRRGDECWAGQTDLRTRSFEVSIFFSILLLLLILDPAWRPDERQWTQSECPIRWNPGCRFFI
jgi:hypothetical protein